MSDNEKSTDPGLSAAKRRELRGHETQEAIADHEKTQKVECEQAAYLRSNLKSSSNSDGAKSRHRSRLAAKSVSNSAHVNKLLGDRRLARSRTNTTVRFSEVGYFSRGPRGKAELSNLDRDFAVDELAVVYPILNAIFDPIPISAEETDGFVRGRIG